MLIYETQKWGGFAVLWRVFCKCDLTGSVFPTVLPWACVAAVIASVIKLDQHFEWGVFSSVHDDSLFDQTYALQIWATAVSFALVFRGNLAYGRFWEGRIQIAKFSSYMQDTALMCVCFDEANKNMNQYREWKQEIVHLFSLLHAVGLQCLRGDDNLENLNMFDPWEGYKQSLAGHAQGTGLLRKSGGSLPKTAAGTSVVNGLAAAPAPTTKTQLPVRSATQARRYSVKPGVRFEQMQAALAAEQEVGEASTTRPAVQQAASSDAASAPKRRPAAAGLSVDVGDVNLNMVLESEDKRSGVSRTRKANRASSSNAAERRGQEGTKPREVSRVVPAEIAPDPALMSRHYDEQFRHPMDDERVVQTRIAAATETFHRMDRNMNGQLCKGDLRRVFEQDREQHLAATRALEIMAAKEAEEQALRDTTTSVLIPSSGAVHDDDVAAAAAAAATRSPAGPKRMKKPKKMKKPGQRKFSDNVGGNSGASEAESLIPQQSQTVIDSAPAASSVTFSAAEPDDLSRRQVRKLASADLPERQVRKLALQAMQVMRVDVSLRTDAQAKLLLDWVSSVPFFRDNAPSEDAMSAISKEVTALTFNEGENIISQGETGDAFYVLLSGDVNVLVNGNNVGKMTVPSSFGDKALEGDDVRAATVRASTGVTVARLSRDSYHASIKLVTAAAEVSGSSSPDSNEHAALDESIRMADYSAALMIMMLPLEQRSNTQNRNLEEWVGSVDYFKMNARTEQHRIEIAKALEPVYVNDEEDVFKQGDIGDAFYCIMQGEVDIIVDGTSVGTLTAGKCFGDRALEASLVEGGEPDRRAATIRAVGDISLARLSAAAYHACIDRVMMAASATPRAANRAETDLQVLAKAAAEHPLSVIAGVSREERIALDGCETFNGSRVIIAQSWITQAIVRRRRAGGLDVDAPTLSTGVFRNFQCANDAYFQCKKIVDTPFPYPYAQSMLLMLCLYTLFSPFMICQIVNSTPWAIATSFITVGIFVTMNEVARGLEEPFGSGDDSNKIAVDALHMDFNENLWCLTQKVYQR